jgi:NitT/TauT family transport system ATP-binding protein
MNMEPAATQPKAAPIVEARDVTHHFYGKHGAITALENFSISVRPGEVLAIVGASGCGKTTFLNMVAGFLRPSAGEIFFRGEPVRGIEPLCTMIFQQYALFPWKTVRKNVEFGPQMRGVGRKERTEIADLYLKMVGLVGFENSYPSQLSGGMRQRVALCRALANEPEVMLCDEPFAALDAMTRQVMQEELLRIVDESNKTVIFITHSIDEALVISDRVAVMSARPGRIKQIMQNDLPRPRHVEVQLSDEFLKMKRQIWESVEEEVFASIRRQEGT